MGYIACIESRLNLTEQRCNKLKRNYELYDYLWTTDLNEMFSVLGDGYHKTRNGRAWPLTKNRLNRNLLERLNLELFEEKIQLYQSVQQEVDDMKPTHEIDFLRIQSQPVKQALSRGADAASSENFKVASSMASQAPLHHRCGLARAVSRWYVCHAGATSGCFVSRTICKRSS